MAVRTPTITEIKPHGDDGHVIEWTGLAAATSDTGLPIEMIGSSDRSVQVSGTFSGTTIVVEGSNDGTTYHTLTDPQGNALSWTSADRLEQVMELTRYIRPRVSGGSGTLVCTMLVKRVR